jgi:histidinol-phosphate aminotransferase
MPYLQQTAPPFLNISALAAEVAIASLDDLDILQSNRDWLVAERARVASALAAISGVEPYPSATNFILFRLPMENAGPVATELASRKVFVRKYTDPTLALEDHLRVSIGSERENDMLLATLKEVLAGAR